MLYQKHLTCHFFTPPTSSLQDLNPSSPLSSSPSISPQEMECVERALKGSFRKELKLNHQHQLQFSCLDEGYACNQSGVVSVVEDFFVDDLLDLSTMTNPKEESLPQEESKEDFEKSKTCPVQNSVQSNNLSPKQDFISTELAVPEDDVAEDLEWLSHFVEDSFSEYSLTASLPTKKETEPEAGLTPPVRGKARSKRARKIRPAMGWCLVSEDSSITTSSSSSTSSPTSSHLLIYCNTANNNSDSTVGPHEKRREDKKQKRGHAGKPGNGIVPLPRRCSHCGVQKTPQWRAGPLGAKTLCNACGVRFKSGRLLPEYRPACSPTFSSDLHSNHHRKVLEMRRQKENELPESGLAQAVQSF